MNIFVNHYFNYEEDVSVLVDGYCNHAGYEISWDTSELVDPDGQDMIQDEIIDTCTRCGCYRYHLGNEYSEWYGVPTLPDIKVKNSGKVFSDVR